MDTPTPPQNRAGENRWLFIRFYVDFAYERAAAWKRPGWVDVTYVRAARWQNASVPPSRALHGPRLPDLECDASATEGGEGAGRARPGAADRCRAGNARRVRNNGRRYFP